MRWTRSAIVAVVGYSSAFCPYRAEGYPVTFEFAGEITYVRDDDNLLGGAVTVGSPFSALYTFESTTPDSDPDEPRRGLYADTISFVSGDIAGIPFLGPLGPTDFVDVRDFPNTSFDRYLVYAEVELLSTALDFKLGLPDQSGTAFQSDSLPLAAPEGCRDTSAGGRSCRRGFFSI